MGHVLAAVGRVESLCVNGEPCEDLFFHFDGPFGDTHRSFVRSLSGHDGDYMRTSSLLKGGKVFNWRSWTGLSTEELGEISTDLGVSVPAGCLLENLILSGVPNFSQLPPTSRLVFPPYEADSQREKVISQAILAVWEENSPCSTVGQRLEEYHSQQGLRSRFVAAAQHRRGVMGIVLSPGRIRVGDSVHVYAPPVRQ